MSVRTGLAIVALLAALAGVVPHVSAAPPAKVEIAWEVQRNGSAIADVVTRLEHDGRTYRLEETWKGRGVYALRGEAKRSSRGRVTPEGLRPESYADERGSKSSSVRFDWAAKKVILTDKGASQERPLPAHPADRLSLVFGFAFVSPGASTIVRDVVDGRGSSPVVYKSAGREQVVTPAGTFDALRLVKQRDGSQDRATELWLAERHGLVPVRVLVTEQDGTRLDQRATRIDLR